MKRFFTLYSLTAFFLLLSFQAFSQIYQPEGLNMPGSWDSWNNPPSIPVLANATQKIGGLLDSITTAGTRRWHTTIHCAASGGDITPGTYEFLFTSGPATNYFANKWGGITVSMNSLQTYTFGGSNNSITLADGKWYTMNWEDQGYGDTRAVFMETSTAPVTFIDGSQFPLATDVSDNDAVTVTVTTSAVPSAEEHIYVRYSTDGWTTSAIAAVSFPVSGSTGTAVIPAQSAGTTVSYYVFSTTVSAPTADYDLLTINYDNNSGSNYSYTTQYGTTQAGDWNTAATWKAVAVPSGSNDVIIEHAVTVTNAVSTPAVCNNLIINSGASLTVNTGKALTVNGNLTNNGAAAALVVSSGATAGNGSLIVNGTVTGNAMVQRYISGWTSASDGWHLISSPVANFTISGSDFVPTSGNDDLFKYDESAATNIWLNYNGGTFGDTQFEVGRGYLAAYKTSATKTFKGVINAGTVTKSNLNYTSGSPNEGWNLLGNPYTSAIDWDSITKSSNVDGAVYVLQADTGSYISWNGTTGSLTDGIIPATNGYFVHVTATGQSVTMEPADQLHSSTANYKNSKVPAPATFVITVSGTNGESKEYIQFRNKATTGFDPAMDAYKLFGFSVAPQIYTSDGKNLYSINCLPLDISNYNLPVSVKFSAAGKYKLTFSRMDKVKNYDIQLEDLQTQKTIPVNAGTSYSFSFKKGDDPNRFVLHINGVTAVPNVNKTDDIQVFAYGHTVYLNGRQSLNGRVSIFNTLGQQVYSGVLNGASKQQIRLSQRQGIYFVRLEESNHVVTKKVFIQ